MDNGGKDWKAELANKGSYGFDDLMRVLEALLGPGGCPWDREQTHESLKRYLIEEAYEVLEAIDLKDDRLLCDELGDVLLQVAFHANIAKTFGISDVADHVCKKMISRHPHVFGSVTADTADEVLTNWESIKRREKGQTEGRTQVLKGVPANLPALMRAYKVQQKARDAGFDWDAPGPVLDKAEEELAELRAAVNSGDQAAAEEEFGDLLFAAVNVSRFIGVHPELALTAAVEKFIRRFEAAENMIKDDGLQMDKMGLAELDAYWEKVKSLETKNNRK